MALDLTSTVDNNITQVNLYELTKDMSIEEMKDFFASDAVNLTMDGAKFNSSGEMLVDPILPSGSLKLNNTTPDLDNSGNLVTTAYPLKTPEDTGSWADKPAIEPGDETWEIQTTHGPATSYIDPSERTVLYTDENGDPVYSNMDGDYLYDDYDGNPVYYDTDTALANGADAYVYSEDGATMREGVVPGKVGITNGEVGGNSKGSKSGGTGAQVGDGNVVGTRLTNPAKNAADYAAITDYARLVNKNLIDKTAWQENPLDRYTSYTYLIEIFCVDVDTYQSFQEADDRVQFMKSLDPSKRYTWYKTGISSDVILENLEIKSHYGSNSTYRNVIFTELNMIFHEPSGASLLEILKEIASDYGYISIASMPHFMFIKYVGYVGDGSDDDGMQEQLAGYDTFIPFYISKFIPTINLDTKYVIQGFPISVMAVTKSVFTLKTDISIDIKSGSTLGDMIEAVGKEVNRQYVEGCTLTSQSLYKRANQNSSKVYKYDNQTSTAIFFDVDSTIAQIPLDNNKISSQFPEIKNNGDAITLRFSNGTSLNNVIDEMRKVVNFSSMLHGNVFENSDGSEASPEDWMEICKTFSFVPETTFIGQDPDTGRAVNSFIYKIFKKYNPCYIPPFETLMEKDRAKYNKAKYRELLCKSILDNRGLVKKYDSYNTGMNDQVINVKLDLDNLFYVRIPTKDVMDPSANVKVELEYDNPYDSDIKEKVNVSQEVKEVIEEHANFNGMLPQRDTIREYGTNASGDSVNGSDRALNSIYNEIYRSGGMLQLSLMIKGDPYWISNYALSRNSVDDKEDGKTCWFKNGLLHFFFKVTLPRVTQDYHNDPVDDGESVYNGVVNKTISGVYMVISVTSQFQQGKFTQTIDSVLNSNLPMEFNGRIINSTSRDSQIGMNTEARDEIKASDQIDQENSEANKKRVSPNYEKYKAIRDEGMAMYNDL